MIAGIFFMNRVLFDQLDRSGNFLRAPAPVHKKADPRSRLIIKKCSRASARVGGGQFHHGHVCQCIGIIVGG